MAESLIRRTRERDWSMGLFNRKDWNVIAIMFETKAQFQVNGNRGKGSAAETMRDNVKRHPRTVFWAVFDQKGSVLEAQPGPGREIIHKDVLKRLERELPRIKAVRTVLTKLESGDVDKIAMALNVAALAPPRPTGEPEEG